MEKRRVEGVFQVRSRKGLHARAAAVLARTASRFSSEVTVARDTQQANAKSVMGVLLLCGSQGSSITVTAEGEDAASAVSAIGELFENRFGEPE